MPFLRLVPMPHDHRFHALSAALLALGLVAGGLTAVAAPGAQAHADSAAHTQTEEAPEPASLIVAPTDPVLRPNSTEVELTVLVRNPGPEELPGGSVALRFDSDPVADRDAITAELPVGAPRIGEAEFGATAPGEEQVTTVTVPRDRIPLASDAPFGTHLIEAVLTTDQAEPDSSAPEAEAEAQDPAEPAGQLSATTPIVWRGSGATPPTVPLGTIVPLVFPDDVHTLPTRRQLEDLAPGWDALLTEARNLRATLAVDPRIISGIRAYGDEAPQNARDLLERMTTLELPTFLLQFADADPAAQAALGFTQLLTPTSLDFVSRFGTFTEEVGEAERPPAVGESSDTPPRDPADAVDPAPEAEAGAGEPTPRAGSRAVDAPEAAPGSERAPDPEADPDSDPARSIPARAPELSELLAWPGAESVAWPAEGAVDQSTLDFLEANGIPTVVIDSGNVAGSSTPRASLGAGSALVTDAILGSASTAAMGAETAAERAAGSARLTAELALSAQRSAPGLLLGLDRGSAADTEAVATVLQQLDSLDWVVPTAVRDLPSGSATLRAGDTLEERRELLRSAAGRESSVNALGAVLVHPEYLSGYQRTRLMELFATRFATPATDFPEVASAYRKRDAELLTGVRAISTEHTQLVGTSTRVPVQLQNALPFDARVQVRVAPSSAALSISERTYPDIAVPAEANQRVLVPVQSRVSSGESGLIVSVAAASGEPTVFTGTLPISIRSSVETIGLWILGGLAALLLGFGIWRSLRRSQRGARTPVDPEQPGQEASPENPGSDTLNISPPAQE